METTHRTNSKAYTSARLILLQDLVLSVLASLLSILLIRWITEPIPRFTLIVSKWLLAALVGSILGFALSGLSLVVRRYLSYSIVSKMVLAILIKEAILVLVTLFLIKHPTAAVTVTAFVVDILLTAIALGYPRYASSC